MKITLTNNDNETIASWLVEKGSVRSKYTAEELLSDDFYDKTIYLQDSTTHDIGEVIFGEIRLAFIRGHR